MTRNALCFLELPADPASRKAQIDLNPHSRAKQTAHHRLKPKGSLLSPCRTSCEALGKGLNLSGPSFSS